MPTNNTRTFKLKTTNAKSSFYNLFDDDTELKVLPLTHKQDWFTAKTTLKEGKLKPTPCDVFEGEDLIYYFYGKPSYFIAQNVGSRGDSVYFPVCFIIDIEKVKIDKVFPFDSGAFANGMYDGFIHSGMDINDFSVKPTIEQIAGLVKNFFINNDNYYRSKPKCCSDDYEDNDEVKAYVNIINNIGQEKFDERSSAIEIISKSENILKESLVAIILPADLAVSNKNVKEMADRGVEMITYDTFGGNPGSYNPVIRQLLYNYLNK